MKKPEFKLAAAARLYASQYDLASYRLERLIQDRREAERDRDQAFPSVVVEFNRLSNAVASPGGQLQRYHLMRLAAQLIYERAISRLETMNKQIDAVRGELAALRQRLRMLELLKNRQEHDWNVEVERQLEAESSYLHLIRNHSGRQV
jgi:hypothetical protein